MPGAEHLMLRLANPVGHCSTRARAQGASKGRDRRDVFGLPADYAAIEPMLAERNRETPPTMVDDVLGASTRVT
jgi:hypothetical protein